MVCIACSRLHFHTDGTEVLDQVFLGHLVKSLLASALTGIDLVVYVNVLADRLGVQAAEDAGIEGAAELDDARLAQQSVVLAAEDVLGVLLEDVLWERAG